MTQDRVLAQIAAWREDLINLNRNNRLLYFRRTKSSTLQIVQPGPTELLQRISASRGLTIWEPPEDILTAEDDDNGAEPPRDLNQTLLQSSRHRPPSNSTHAICDVSSLSKLRGTLKWLERRTNQEFMDRGLWILYLGVGMLDWVEPPREAEEAQSVSSPLLLVPVSLSHDGTKGPFVMRRADEDASVNPALTYKLSNDFGISLPGSEDADEDDLDGFLETVRRAVAGQTGWVVSDKVVLSVFSFHKEVMYQDLKKNEAAVADHPVVQALALGHRGNSNLGFDEIPEDQLDESHPPETVFTILDADSSQRQCLAAAASGNSFIIEGPPGTGKSQTIANLIADTLGRNKTVLFVSEKAAALEVVHNRLERTGLAEFVLELHSHKATRKQVAQNLGRSLNCRLSPRAELSATDIQRLARHRRELNAYVLAMNEVREPLGRSVHQIIGELASVQNLPQPPQADEITSSLSAENLAEIIDASNVLANAWGPVVRGDGFLWRVSDTRLTQARRASLVAALTRGALLVEQIALAVRDFAETTGLPWGTNLDDAVRFRAVGKCLAGARSAPREWLCVPSLESISSRVNELRETIGQLHAAIGALESEVGARWRDLDSSDLAAIRQTEAQLHNSPFAFLATRLQIWRDASSTAETLTRLLKSVERVRETAASVAPLFEVQPPNTVAQLRRLLDIALVSVSPSRPDASWLDPGAASSALGAADLLEPIVQAQRSLLEEVRKLFSDNVLELDVEGLELRFREVHRGLGKLRPAYWRDRRALRTVAKSGRVRPAEVGGLATVVEATRNARRLSATERVHESKLGSHYYRSLDTDFRQLRIAIHLAQATLDSAGEWVPFTALRNQLSVQSTPAPALTALAVEFRARMADFERETDSLGPALSAVLVASSLDVLLDPIRSSVLALDALTEKWRRSAEIASNDNVGLDRVMSWLSSKEGIETAEFELARRFDADRRLLGSVYRGAATDFSVLEADLNWTKEIRELLRGPVTEDVANRLSELESSGTAHAARLLDEWMEIEQLLLAQFAIHDRKQWVSELRSPFADLVSLLVELAGSVDDIVEWGAYQRAVSALGNLGLAKAVQFCVDRRVEAADAAAILRRCVLDTWLDAVSLDDDRLRTFRSVERDQLATTFRSLDRRFVDLAVAKVIHTCNARRPTTVGGAASLVATEANKQKRHMPTRKLIESAGSVVQALKPCMMMSPLTVSQFLPPHMKFDLVVFDEASQVRPADAINCIYRGRQVVIAGDQKQLPPTPFFDRLDSDSGDAWEENQLEEYESVLDIAKGAGVLKPISLRWHYRSQHEDLILYSNYHFYTPPGLVTFPSVLTNGPDLGVEFFLAPGVYRRGGARDNPIEAAKVVDRVMFHQEHHPHLSIGVVAFSEAQASTIENEIERRSREHPQLRSMLDSDRLNGGFVKNLESVQGDERDIIIFSIGYGRDEAGRFTLNFGPINKAGGHRRLNVAITRARRRVEVVSSVRSVDFVGEMRADGVRHLRQYLDYAERSDNRLGVLSGELGAGGRDAESPFEEEVAKVIRSWGYEVTPQVGCAEYRIDMAVRHPGQPGRYALGVECDGAMYHSSRVARDRDRLRQDVLARLGWTRLYRIWGLSWYRNRGDEEARLRAAIEQAIAAGEIRHVPSEAQEAPQEAERVEFELNETPEWVIPYTVASLRAPRSSYEMHEGGAQPDLQQLIQAVVSVESPVAKDLVLRRVRECWGMNRAGSRARAAFDMAAKALQRKGLLVIRPDGFYQEPGADEVCVRGGDREAPESIRTIDEIPKEELEAAVDRFVREVHPVSEDELTARVASVFGWNRRGPDIAQKFKRVVSRLVLNGVLRRTENGLTPGG